MNRQTLIKTVIGTFAAVALLGLARPAAADQQLQYQFNMPIQVKCNIAETDCDNSPGPWITIDGEILLGGLQAKLIFQNNVKGTHKATVTVATNIALVPLGGSITLPKQPVLGGVGGNPWIWLQFYDNKGNNLTDEILLGRCVQGLSLKNDFLNQALATSLIAPGTCNNSPGPTITISGDLKLSGLNARLIFRNNAKGTHTAEAMAEVVLLPEGSTIVIPKQPCRGGAGGNPLIWVQFLQGNGDPITDPQFLGRCNQI